MRAIQETSRWRRAKGRLTDFGRGLLELVPSETTARHHRHSCRGRHCRPGGAGWALA